MSSPAGILDEQLVALLRSASFEEATGLIAAGWQLYVPAEADLLRKRIGAVPEEHWSGNAEVVFALACSTLFGAGGNPFAALAYFDAAEHLAEPRGELHFRCALGRARALRGLGRLDDAAREVAIARERLGVAEVGIRTRLEFEARVLFEEAGCNALAGELDAASRQVRHGMGLAGETEPSGMADALGWLAVAEHFGGAASVTAEVPVSAPSLIAAVLGAIDDGRPDDALAEVERLERLPAGREFAAFALVLRSMLAESPLERLDLLQAAQLATLDWQSPGLLRSLHDTERACALIELGSLGPARDAVADQAQPNPLHERHAQCPARPAARLALHAGDFEGVLALTAECESMGDRHAPRSLAWVDVLRAAAHHALGDAGTAADGMDRALLRAARTGWRRQFTSLPPARLRAMLDEARARQQPPEVVAVLDDLDSRRMPEVEGTVAPLTARERMILSRLASGESRQEMSSGLNVSPNTIKAQVRSIYRKLGAANRHEAIDRAAQYGIAP